MELNQASLGAYLQGRGVAPEDAAIEVVELAGGVSNTVLCARWPGGAVVVKQSLARLRVAVDWQFDRARILVERDCLLTLDELLPGVAPVVVFSDEAEFVLGMTLAPDDGEVWRAQLADGRVDPATVERAATLLARLQGVTADSAAVAARFDDRMPLIQGRLDPFHRHVAQRHPDLAGRIEDEIARTLTTRSALVHGDYSPKNLLAYRDRVLVLDCEVAHWGDPAFDVAFLLCHLLLDGGHRPELAPAYAGAAIDAWRSYRAAGGRADDEAAVVAELGCLVLARVDGKSPLPNLVDRADAVRAFGRDLLVRSPAVGVEAAIASSVDFLAPSSQDRA